MKNLIVSLLSLAACKTGNAADHYGFLALLGRDTVSIESVSRTGNKIVSEEVDRFPRVRQRHTEVSLGDDGSIERLVMDIHTPSEPENERDRHVEVDVSDVQPL